MTAFYNKPNELSNNLFIKKIKLIVDITIAK